MAFLVPGGEGVCSESQEMRPTSLHVLSQCFGLAVLVCMVPMARGESVSGRIVEQDAGRGIAGVGVILTDVSREDVGWSVYSDAQGYYRLSGVPPGEYKLIVSAPRYALHSPVRIVVAGGRNNEGVDVALKKPQKLHLKPVWIGFFGIATAFGFYVYVRTRRGSMLLLTIASGCIVVGTYLEDGFYEYVALGAGMAIGVVGMGVFCREYRIEAERREGVFAGEMILGVRRDKKGENRGGGPAGPASGS